MERWWRLPAVVDGAGCFYQVELVSHRDEAIVQDCRLAVEELVGDEIRGVISLSKDDVVVQLRSKTISSHISKIRTTQSYSRPMSLSNW